MQLPKSFRCSKSCKPSQQLCNSMAFHWAFITHDRDMYLQLETKQRQTRLNFAVYRVDGLAFAITTCRYTFCEVFPDLPSFSFFSAIGNVLTLLREIPHDANNQANACADQKITHHGTSHYTFVERMKFRFFFFVCFAVSFSRLRLWKPVERQTPNNYQQHFTKSRKLQL